MTWYQSLVKHYNFQNEVKHADAVRGYKGDYGYNSIGKEFFRASSILRLRDKGVLIHK